MSKPFDATLKSILEYTPSDWPFLLGRGRPRVDVIDADIATITGATDKVLHVKTRSPWLLDINFQSGPDASLPERVHLYNAALRSKHSLLVRSLVVLLAPRANLASITGMYKEQFEDEPEPHVVFRYGVLRLWQEPTEQFLTGGIGLLPLAPMSDVRQQDLPGVITEMKRRLDREPHPARRRELWTATYTLMGLRYERALTNRLLQGVVEMEESVTYQAIIEKGVEKGIKKGALQEARKTVLLLGKEQFGAPSAAILKLVESIDDLERLEQLSLRLLKVKSWQELLEPPATAKRKKS